MTKNRDTQRLGEDSEPGFSAPLDADGGSDRILGTQERKEFFLPVSGFVWFYPEEVEVIDHPAFQRLSRINQLGHAAYVYRGATHKWIEHALGTVGAAQNIIAAIYVNAEKARLRSDPNRRAPLSNAEERLVRLAALLRGIGQIALGHVFELALNLGTYDGTTRLDLVFDKTDWLDCPVESLASRIDRHFHKFVPDNLKDKLSASTIIKLIIRARPQTHSDSYHQDPYEEEQSTLSRSSEIRLGVAHELVSGGVSASLLDYIYRDWYHVGKPVPTDDRIFRYMEIATPDVSFNHEDGVEQGRSSSDTLILSISDDSDSTPRVRTDGIAAILSLIERRYELLESIMHHRTKLAADAMLGRALYELWGDRDHFNLLTSLLSLADDQIVDAALREAEARASEINLNMQEQSVAAADYLLNKLRSRSLFTPLYTVRSWMLSPDRRVTLATMFSDSGAAANRTLAARVLERDFELPAGSVAIGGSSAQPHISNVRVGLVNGIAILSQYESQAENEGRRSLTGGHLSALIRRYDDLWRCDFFVAREVLSHIRANAPEKLDLMRDTIDQLLVNPPSSADALDRSSERLAQSYVAQETRAGRSKIQFVSGSESTTIFGNRSNELLHYPGGARALSSYRRSR